MRRHQPRVSNLAAGADRDRRDRDRLLLRVRRLAAVLRHAVRAQGDVHDRDRAAHPVAGADRRRRRRPGRRRCSASPARSNAAVVTMNINTNGLPIHADATAKIRPRLFLEGNFYVDLHPGTPSAPIAVLRRDAAGRADTSGPVQLDRVLVVADTRTRARTCRRCCRGSARRSTRRRTAAQDATQDPSVRGLTGGAGAQPVAEVLGRRVQGLGDRQPGAARAPAARPLRRRRRATRRCFRALAASGNAALEPRAHVQRDDGDARRRASRSSARRSRCCRRCCGSTDAADTALDASFGPTKQFAARARCPGIKQLGPTIDAGAARGSRQATALVSKQELGGLLADLTPAVQNTGQRRSARPRRSSPRPISSPRCFDHNIDPDRQRGHHRPAGRHRPAASTRSCSRARSDSPARRGNFDGNGRYVRSSAGGGDIAVQTPPLPSAGPLYGNAVLPAARHAPGVRGQARRRSAATSPATRTPRRTSTTSRREPGREARDPHPPQRLRRDHRARRARARGRRLHPRAPARRSRSARATTRSTPQFQTGAAVTAGQGQSVDDRRRPGRPGRRRQARGRPRRRDDEHLQEVPADLQATRPCCCGRARR